MFSIRMNIFDLIMIFNYSAEGVIFKAGQAYLS